MRIGPKNAVCGAVWIIPDTIAPSMALPENSPNLPTALTISALSAILTASSFSCAAKSGSTVAAIAANIIFFIFLLLLFFFVPGTLHVGHALKSFIASNALLNTCSRRASGTAENAILTSPESAIVPTE